MTCAAYDVAGCNAGCPYNVSYFATNGCLTEFDAMNACLAALQPSDWVCLNSSNPVQKAGLCSSEIMAFDDCFAKL